MRRLRGSRGATLVEFALVFPLFILLIMGTIDMGRYMAATASVNTAAREAARYGSSVGLNNGGTVARYLDCDGIVAAGVGYGAAVDFQSTDFAISFDDGPAASNLVASCVSGSVDNPADVESGDRVVVTVTRPFSMLSPIVGSFFGPITITSVDRRTLLST